MSLPQVIPKGESATLELKRSTGELREEAMQTLCPFANATRKMAQERCEALLLGAGNGGPRP